MKYRIIILSVFIISVGNLKCCNIDSLFNHHISSIESYIDRVIKGEILPTGSESIVYASIDQKPIKTQYNTATKFVILGDNATLLKMYEMLNEDIEFERGQFFPNVKISYEEIKEIKTRNEINRKKLNDKKIIEIFRRLKNGHNKIKTNSEAEIYF
ncbi:hypothetical protein [Dysgonomonas sp. Marseille-P4361]|uniref:hypothetical protein n=1 Tax=Dysgonomonas sp. Marseille-P4361 TaxID=2161820 RepID=UPI000D55EF1C|nr:hypothetical protein [Dysgonomonas sp. Marseille-P4361]